MKIAFCPSGKIVAALACALATFLTPPLHAASYTWIGGTSGTWDATPTNWSGGTGWGAGTTDSAMFSTAALNGTVSGTVSLGGLTFSQSTTLSSGTVSMSGTLTVASAATVNLNSYLKYTAGNVMASSGTLNLGSVYGSGNLTMSGSGFFALNSGTLSNLSIWQQGGTVNQGAATVSAGRVMIGYAGSYNSVWNVNSASSSLASTSDIFLGRAGKKGTLNINAGNVTAATDFSLVVDANASSHAAVNMSGGSLTLSSGTLYINKSGTYANQTGTFSLSGGTVTAPAVVFGGASGAYGANATASLVMTGGTLYVGPGGIIKAANAPALSTMKVSGGVIGATTGNWASSMNMVLGGTNGNITFQAGNSSATARNITLSGVLSGTGGLIKTGGGTLTLSGSNTYTGSTNVTRGSLVLGHPSALGNSSNVSLGSWSKLDSSGLASGYTLGAGVSLMAGNGSTIKGSLDLGTNSLTLDFDGTRPGLGVMTGAMTFHDNPVTVMVVGEEALSVGTYPVITTHSGGSIAGSVVSSTVTVTGMGLSGSLQAALVSSGSGVDLVVSNPTAAACDFDAEARSGLSAVQASGLVATLQIIGNAVAATDGNGNSMSVSSTGTAAHGTVTTDGVTIFYTPAADFTGTDAFTYTVSNGQGGFTTATITVTVKAVVGATVPFTSFEGESGTLGGGAIVRAYTTPATDYWHTPEMEASGRAFVELKGTGQSLTWSNTTSKTFTALNLRYSIPDAPNGGGTSATLNLYVDGVYRQTLLLSSTQTWVYSGPNVNDQDEDPAIGHPHVFYQEMHGWIAGGPVAPGSQITLKQDAENTAAFYWIDVIDLEAPPAPLAQPADSLSITDFGAVSTTTEGPIPADAVDCSSAIQACINAAQLQGKSVWIPQGRFVFRAGFSVSGVTIEGAGPWYSSLYRRFIIPSGYEKAAFGGVSSTFRNFYIDTNAIHRSWDGGCFGGMNIGGENWLIENMWAQHTDTGGWLSGFNGIIRNCRFTDTWGDGLNLNNGSAGGSGNNLTAENNFVRGVGDDGVTINSAADGNQNQMENPVLRNNTTIAVHWADGLRIAGGRNVLVENNYLIDPTNFPGIIVGVFNAAPLESGIVRNNVILRGGGNTYNQNRAALYITGGATTDYVANVVISDNIILDSIKHALQIGTSENIVLKNNRFDRIWEGNATPSGSAVKVLSGAVGSAVLFDNTFENLLPGQTPLVYGSGADSFFLGGARNQGVDIPSPVSTPWTSQDVGNGGVAGASSSLEDNFTVIGSGTGIGGTQDGFHFIHQALAGDTEIRARVWSIENYAPQAKAGLMMRSSLDAGSPNVAALVTPADGVLFQTRSILGGATSSTQLAGASAPYWVRLVRQGSTVSGYASLDQIHWTPLGTQTLSGNVSMGLAATSGVNDELCASMLDSVGTPEIPSLWTAQDIGAVGSSGWQTYCAGTQTFSLTAAGADIGDTSDSFRYISMPVAGDCFIAARVVGLDGANAQAKAGVMMRETSAAGSANASVVVTASNGVLFQWRSALGGSTTVVSSTVAAVTPCWVKLERTSNTFTALQSTDGTSWTAIGTADITMATSMSMGLVSSSHDSNAFSTAVIDNMNIFAPGLAPSQGTPTNWLWDPSQTGIGSDGGGTWGNSSAVFTNGTTDLIFAPGVVTRSSGTTAIGSSTITLTSATGIVVGDAISLGNFAAGTVVTAISGSTVTLSTSATSGIASNTTITFVGANDVQFGTGTGAAATITLSGTQYAGAMTINPALSGSYIFNGYSIVLGTEYGSTGVLTIKDTARINSYLNAKSISFASADQELTLGGGASLGSAVSGTTLAVSMASTLALASGTYTGSNYNISIGDALAGTGGLVVGSGVNFSVGGSGGIGYNATGLVVVEGGYFANASTGLSVGRSNGTGRMIVNSGTAIVTTPHLTIANGNSTGVVDVNGGLLSSTINPIIINNAATTGTALLNVNGGIVDAMGLRFGSGTTAYTGGVAKLAMSGGSLYLSGSGMVLGATGGGLTPSIVLSGGTIGAKANWNSSLAMILASTNGNVTFQAANVGGVPFNIGLTGVLSGTGGLIKTGAGTLALGASNTYSGGTIVNGGTLLVENVSGSGLGTGAVEVANGATLAGTGTIGGAVTINGTLTPGAAGSGTMRFNAGLAMGSSSALNVAVGTAGGLVTVNGNLTLGGTLNVADAGGFGLGTYRLINYSGTLTNNGLVIGSTPNPAYLYVVDTSIAGQVNLQVLPPPPVITSEASASGMTGSSFVFQITATNNPTSYGTSGLPAGLTVNPATGLIEGIPTVTGVFNVSLSASNAGGTGTGTLTITIVPPPPVITSAPSASGMSGSPFAFQITATNNPTSFGASGLPSGLTLNPGTGLIEGIPTVTGVFSVNLSASNAGGTGSATLTITILPPPPSITSAATANATSGSAFVFQITASNSPTSYDASGLPAGLTVNTSSGLINGTPTVTGTFSAGISATNAGGAGSATLTITILPPAPVITSAATANGTSGTAFSYQITASNNPGSYDASGLPAGLTVNTSSGFINGTPTLTGTFSAGISATNAGGIGSATLTITILPPVPDVPSGLIATGSDESISLNWSDANGATTYNVKRSLTSGTGYVTLTNTAQTNYTDTNVTNGTTYYYVVSAVNEGGESANSLEVSGTPTGLPSPWIRADIGTTGTTGSASYVAGTYTIAGAGAGIGSTSDAFNYVYQLSGSDCSVVARVTSIQNTGTNAKAGVMIRNSLAANALEAGVWVTPNNGIQFTYRSIAGNSTVTKSSAGKTAPYWVKVARIGTAFKGYYSADGITWTQIGTPQNLPMGTDTYIGLGVTSNVVGTLNTSILDNVTATP